MRFKLLSIFVIIILFSSGIVAAESQYGKIDVYYNGELLPGTEVAKPVLKIGEPFSIAVEMTLYQDCQATVEISELGSNDFIVLEGPSDFGEFHDKIFIPNETCKFEWMLKPTENWVEGSMPIDFFYSILLPGEPEPIVNGEFTIAVPYITNEYYEGSIPSPGPTNTNEPESTPAFTLLASILAITLATRRV